MSQVCYHPKSDSSLGDLPEEEFRAALSSVAEWAARYRSEIEKRSISPQRPPGEVTAHLSPTIPEQPVSLEKILADFDQLILPHLVHWGHPAFLGYFGSTTTESALATPSIKWRPSGNNAIAPP